MKKYSYNDEPSIESMPDYNPFFNETSGPVNQFFPIGETMDMDQNLDTMENREKDGNEFDEFKEKRKERLKKLKELKKDNKTDTLQPTQFYESMYGSPADLTGLYSSPMEYYSGSIADSPNAVINPYNNTYQSANSRMERLQIRGMIFNNYKKYGYTY